MQTTTKFVVGARTYPLENCEWLCYLEKVPLVNCILFAIYRLINHPGPRHIEYFHLRYDTWLDSTDARSGEKSKSISGHIASWAAEGQNQFLILFKFYNAKVVLNRFNYDFPNQWTSRGNWIQPTNIEGIAKFDAITNDGFVDEKCELRKNKDYQYLVWYQDPNALAFSSIQQSYQEYRPGAAVEPSVIITKAKYGFFAANCGHYVKQYLTSRIYLPYEYYGYDEFLFRVENLLELV